MTSADRALVWAGVVLGAGLAGFFDGIFLHQILQWHHMVCVQGRCAPTSIADLQAKIRVDGYFHAAMYGLTIAGVGMLFNAAKKPAVTLSWALLIGALLLGFGGFNVVEGLIDHHLLKIHHVRPGPNQGLWDLSFLLFNTLLVLAGGAQVRSSIASRPDPSAQPS